MEANSKVVLTFNDAGIKHKLVEFRLDGGASTRYHWELWRKVTNTKKETWKRIIDSDMAFKIIACKLSILFSEPDKFMEHNSYTESKHYKMSFDQFIDSRYTHVVSCSPATLF